VKVEEGVRKGRVLWVGEKFYGIIQESSGEKKEFFFHCNDVTGGVKDNDNIDFQIGVELEGQKRSRAANVSGGSVSRDEIHLTLNVAKSRVLNKKLEQKLKGHDERSDKMVVEVDMADARGQ
jgi:hypothetical protein